MNSEGVVRQKFPTEREAFGVLLLTFFMYLVLVIVFGGTTNKYYVLLLEILFIIPTLLFVWRKKYPFGRIFRFRKVSLSLVYIGAGLGAGLSVLGDFMDRWVHSIIPMPEAILHALKDYMSFHSLSEAILVLFTVVVVAGIVEEMLFRGFLQNIMEQNGGILKSILVPAFVFSVFHFNPWGVLQIFAIGAVLGMLSWRSQSILPCIVAHGVHNGVAAILYNLSPKQMEWYAHGNSIRPFWIVMAIGITAISLLFLLNLNSSTKRDEV